MTSLTCRGMRPVLPARVVLPRPAGWTRLPKAWLDVAGSGAPAWSDQARSGDGSEQRDRTGRNHQLELIEAKRRYPRSRRVRGATSRPCCPVLPSASSNPRMRRYSRATCPIRKGRASSELPLAPSRGPVDPVRPTTRYGQLSTDNVCADVHIAMTLGHLRAILVQQERKMGISWWSELQRCVEVQVQRQ
jgi:hypothetical protein